VNVLGSEWPAVGDEACAGRVAIWKLHEFRPNQAPVVNVVAAVLIVVSIVPIWLAQRLSGDSVRVSQARVKADRR
jgi:putative spermidine/putrescine transport system permease protein